MLRSMITDYIGPKRPPVRPDGKPMTPDNIRELREQIADFDETAWIDEATREIVEKFMPIVCRKEQARYFTKRWQINTTTHDRGNSAATARSDPG
jgi:hypothetical protein